MGYPVLTAGMVLAPRGVGTMLMMFIVGRLIGRIDPRLIIGVGPAGDRGLALRDEPVHAGCVADGTIVRTGFTQGLGFGLIFVPLSTVTFATLPPEWRTDATGLFSLMRNLGSSIGISIVISLLRAARRPTTPRSRPRSTPFNPPSMSR